MTLKDSIAGLVWDSFYCGIRDVIRNYVYVSIPHSVYKVVVGKVNTPLNEQVWYVTRNAVDRYMFTETIDYRYYKS